ncbi:HNH endonuclease [Nocardioides speluncae]|uniref:HNH endonuclease n=1 Tax=Nocardioides speluncae TaxID=2670337 RepID=UPI000D6858C5|nr:HNH endonuclease [Nocardioides speluncae]
MRIVVGVTDNRWAAFLRDRSELTEANFWQPSPHGFKALSPGEPFLFKTKDPKKFRHVDIPGYSLVGGGFFDEYVELRVSEAWTIWGPANGVADEAELLARARSYRAGPSEGTEPDPTIGCVILRNIFFAVRGEELPEPPNWARNSVTHTGYDLAQPEKRPDTEYVQHAFGALQERARIDLVWEPDLRGIALDWQGPRHGPPALVRPRMGQGHFKRAVAAAYENRCVITRSGTFPSLEAAHIRPFAEGGAHAVSNGILLRTDVHRLFDRGYLSIDPDLHLRVSPQLRDHGWNGVEFYDREADGYLIPEPAHPELKPDRDALAWHFETKFRAA